MSKKILCPTDGSDHGTVGVVHAAQFAKATRSQLTIFVVNILHGGADEPAVCHWNADEVAKVVGDAKAIARKAGATNIEAVDLIAHDAAPAIISYSEQNGYDQIVMGTGDKEDLKRIVLGSVAAEVAIRAHCSVTVVR